MENEHKEELDLEDMKNAVNLAAFLPEILSLMKNTNDKVEALNAQFKKQAGALDSYVKLVQSYITAVDELIKQDKSGETSKKVDTLSGTIGNLKSAVNELEKAVKNIKIEQPKPGDGPKTGTTTSGGTKKPSGGKTSGDKEKNYTPKQKEFSKGLEKVIKGFSGRKEMLVTKYSLKGQYRLTEEVSALIIDFFKSNKLYNASSCMASMPTATVVEKYIANIK